MKVYRLPYGRVYHDLERSVHSGLRPWVRCNINYSWNDLFVEKEHTDVPKKDLCRRCFPSPGLGRTNTLARAREIAKIALDHWEEYRNTVNWDRGIDEDGKEVNEIAAFRKELGL